MIGDSAIDVRPLHDQLAIRRVVEECALRGDQRDTNGQLALFEPEAQIAVYYGHQNTDRPVATFHGRPQLAQALSSPDDGRHLYHFLGQTAVDVDGDSAVAQTLCIAYQLHQTPTGRHLRTTYNRYHDEFRRVAGNWLITRRRIFLAWAEDRPLGEDSMAPPVAG